MTRGKSKVAATRHAKHGWSIKRKALAVMLSIALLGLGTPAVSFADSAADQQPKAVEAQKAASAVYAQEQTPASTAPVQQVAASDSDVATDSKVEVDGAADNAAAPVSKENASGAASKDEVSAPASSDDQPSDKASASTEAASKDATPASEAKRDESNGGYYVYLYTKVVGNTEGLTLKVNDNGWYTIGRVWVEGITNPAKGSSTKYDTSSDDYNKVISALKDPSNVDLHGVNNINLEDIEWSVKGQSTGLKMASGAVDFDNSNNPTWHLDGYVDLDKAGFGSICFHYKDKETKAVIAEDEDVTAKVTGKKFDFSNYKISIKGYTYVEADPSSVVVERGVTKEVTLYYTAKQGKVGYYLADSTATWIAPPADTVSDGKQKWYYDYGFAKGDTVKVTKSEPTATGKAFIGWLDKERGDQPAAIKEAGDTVTYIYDGAKTYALDALWASLDVTGYKDTYDGKEHGLASVDVAINKGSDLAQQYQDQAKKFIKQGAVQYSTDDGKTWSDVAPKYKDAGTYSVKVKVDVTVGDRTATLEASANIEIAKRDVTLKPVDAEKPYDGSALTASEFEVAAGSFAVGEGVERCTYSGSQTLVGSSYSAIASATALEGTNLKGNYNVTYEKGNLTVTNRAEKYAIEMQAKSGTAPYSGQEQSVSGFESNVFEFDGVKYIVSGLTATAKGTDAGTHEGTVEGTAVVTDPDGNDVTAQFNVTAQPGELVIEPATAVVMVKGKSAVVPYNGKEQSVEGYEFVSADNPLYVAADVKFSGDAVAKGTDAGIYSMGLSANQFSNTNKNFTNVEFVVEDGWLEIASGDIDESKVSWTLNNLQTKYDGKTHVAGIATAKDEYNNALDVEYSVDGKNWTSNPSDITATNWSDSKWVYLRARSSNYGEGQYAFSEEPEHLIIGQRLLTLTSADAEKTYEGLPLVKNAQTDVSVTGDGFVGDEGAIYDITGSQTQAGSSYNEFTYRLKDNTNAENYRIEMVKGTLKVKPLETKVTVKLKGKTSILDYNGKEQSVEGYEFLSADNSLYTVADVRFDASAVAKGTDTGTHRMGLNASQFSNTNPNFANVAFVVEDGFVAIEPVKLTVTTPNASRVYNGQPLTAEGTIEGFVNGETAVFNTTGSQTAVGESPNTYAIDWNAKGTTAKPTNYTIVKNIGTLTVTAQSIVPDPQNPESYLGVAVGSPSDRVYTGQEQKWAPTVIGEGGNALAAGTDYEVTYGTTDFTNVTGDIVVTVKGKGNYSGEVVRRYKITPATLTVTTPSASRAYNGQPLTAEGSIEGFVNGETAGFETTGSQTAVGWSNNTYAIDWNAKGATAKESNYKIVEKLGKLTVTEHDGEVVATPGSYAGVYDGKPHGVDVTVTGLPEGYTVKAASSNATATDATDEAGVVANVDELVIVNAQGEDVTGKLKVAKNTGSIVITPAPYSVTTESATKVYDGTALTASGKIGGLLEGETANLKVTGSQTKVGASENTYTIEWTGTAEESNYKLESENIGTLTVAAAPDSPTPDDQSKDQGIFNGNDANSGLVQTGDATGIYGMAAIIAAVVAAFVSLLAVRRRKE